MRKEAATFLIVNTAVWTLAVLGFFWRWWYGAIGLVLAALFTGLSLAALLEVQEIHRMEKRSRLRRLS